MDADCWRPGCFSPGYHEWSFSLKKNNKQNFSSFPLIPQEPALGHLYLTSVCLSDKGQSSLITQPLLTANKKSECIISQVKTFIKSRLMQSPETLRGISAKMPAGAQHSSQRPWGSAYQFSRKIRNRWWESEHVSFLFLRSKKVAQDPVASHLGPHHAAALMGHRQPF